ncbi:MAG TPA: hypothetical protein VMN57_10255 [Anaerolineales bacterium]|nr:hypothetical protein [Anaerolineales bacterium]
MSDQTTDLKQIIASAKRLGVVIDEADALQWLAQMAANPTEGDVVVDVGTGVFGHKAVMLDFSSADLAHFRKIGDLVEFGDEPGVVETALALSGSAAQSKIQTYPGDADFFERVNIKAPTQEEACRILSRILRRKALDTRKGDHYQLIEVRMGSYPSDVVRDGRLNKAGGSLTWSPEEIERGFVEGTSPEGEPVRLDWEAMAHNAGWTKLDWVVADPLRKELINASNMLDVTWEAPDGSIVALDGYLDPYFQEVYLEAESIPIFSKLARNVAGNALDEYVDALEEQIAKYITDDLNYGKAAKRMYNVFRLTGRYEEALYLRELFDEPATVLYQIWALIRTIDDVFFPGSTFSKEQLMAQAQELIMLVIRVLEGGEEEAIVSLLLRLRDELGRHDPSEGLSEEAEVARAEVIRVVNNFYYERMIGVVRIKDYMEKLGWQVR